MISNFLLLTTCIEQVPLLSTKNKSTGISSQYVIFNLSVCCGLWNHLVNILNSMTYSWILLSDLHEVLKRFVVYGGYFNLSWDN